MINASYSAAENRWHCCSIKKPTSLVIRVVRCFNQHRQHRSEGRTRTQTGVLLAKSTPVPIRIGAGEPIT